MSTLWRVCSSCGSCLSVAPGPGNLLANLTVFIQNTNTIPAGPYAPQGPYAPCLGVLVERRPCVSYLVLISRARGSQIYADPAGIAHARSNRAILSRHQHSRAFDIKTPKKWSHI